MKKCKGIAIVYNNTVFTEDKHVIDIDGFMPMKSIERLLTAKTSKPYHLVKIDYDGTFEAPTHIMNKLCTAFNKILFSTLLLFTLMTLSHAMTDEYLDQVNDELMANQFCVVRPFDWGVPQNNVYNEINRQYCQHNYEIFKKYNLNVNTTKVIIR